METAPPPGQILLQVSVPCVACATQTVRHRVLHDCDVGPIAGDAALVATELVSNAVRHSCCQTGDKVHVRVERRRDCLHVAVRDPGQAGGRARIIDSPDGIGGLGLKVIDRLTRRWGSHRDRDGYTVWCELPLGA